MTGANRDDNQHDRDAAARADELRVGWRMAGLGMHVASEVLAGLLLGWLYDQWQGTGPTGATIGAVLGIVVGLFSLIHGSMRLMKELDERHPVVIRRAEPEPTDDEPPLSHDQWKKAWTDDTPDDTDDDTYDAADDDWPEPTEPLEPPAPPRAPRDHDDTDRDPDHAR